MLSDFHDFSCFTSLTHGSVFAANKAKYVGVLTQFGLVSCAFNCGLFEPVIVHASMVLFFWVLCFLSLIAFFYFAAHWLTFSQRRVCFLFTEQKKGGLFNSPLQTQASVRHRVDLSSSGPGWNLSFSIEMLLFSPPVWSNPDNNPLFW